MKKIFVTGANGHIGCNAIREALRRGYKVTAMVRKTSDLRGLKGLNIDVCYGDVLDKNSLIEGSRGCDAVLHLAANFAHYAKDPNKITAPAIEGTRNIFEAAHQNGIKRIVYTSSVVAIGWSDHPDEIRTANDWLADSCTEIYSIAKRDSERLAWELSGKYNIPMIAILPAAILGRLDYAVTQSNITIVEIMKGNGLTMNTQLTYVDVRDVARIHVMAIENGTVGKRYLISPASISMKHLGKMVEGLTGKKVLHIPTTRQSSLWIAALMETTARLTNSTPLLTRDVARTFIHRYANFDMQETITDFTYEPTALEETLKDTINWFNFLGYGKLRPQYASQYVPEPDWVK